MEKKIFSQDSQDVISDLNQQEKGQALSDGVSQEPRNDEEMHLGLIKDSSSLIDVYIAVSDDEGELLGDKCLETTVKDFIKDHKNIENDPIENPEHLLQELKNLTTQYSKLVYKTDTITDGTITKYFIRLGMLFNIEKVLVKKANLNWIDWFSKNYNKKRLRSVQDYMKIARIPNVIRYSVFGLERLKEICRAIDEFKDDDSDPFATFLKDYDIIFDPQDPESDDLIDNLKIEVDTAIAMTKIKKVGDKNEIDLDVEIDLIRDLIGLGTTINNGIIRDLVIIKKSEGDVNRYLENRYMNGGKEPEVLTSVKTVQNFPKIVAIIKSTVQYIIKNGQLATQIDSSHIDTLEAQITRLKELINNNDNNDQ